MPEPWTPERARVKGGVVGWGVGGGRRGRMCERMRVVVGGEGSMMGGFQSLRCFVDFASFDELIIRCRSPKCWER